MENTAMAAILRGQESVNALKILTNGSDPTVAAHLENILHSFSLFRFFLDSPKSKSRAKQSLNKKSSRNDNGEGEGSVYRIVDSPTPILGDGFMWRKYGQKIIKGSPYQRSYYKCINGKNQNCNSKKQLQQIKDDPLIFRTTYIGQHICQTNNDNTNNSTTMINFENQDQDLIDSNLPKLISVESDNLIVDDDLNFLLDDLFENDLDFNIF